MGPLTRARLIAWHQVQIEWLERFHRGCGDPSRTPHRFVIDLARHREALAQLQSTSAGEVA